MVTKAVCVLTNSYTKKKINGYILFEYIENEMKISLSLSNLKEGYHGFHIHKTGDLRDGCTSLCSHFNPDNTQHGDIKDSKNNRHAGDLGNIYANADGLCNQILYDKIIKFYGKYNIIGRSIVIHENFDDLGRGGIDENNNIYDEQIFNESLKTGNAGKRIACGVIGIIE